MVPKGFRTNINIDPSKVGLAKRLQLRDDIANNGTFLPKPIGIEDMDISFIEFVKKDLELSIDGEKVPVIFLTIQRWSEFTKTWEFTDENKNIKIPFITIVRKPDVQPGTNQAGLWNIPGNKSYTYSKVPTFDGVRNGFDVYQIPQPTSVDILYEVRLFTNRLRDLNLLNEKIQNIFKARQYYIGVNKHPIPLVLESISDESQIEDFENRRFYVQTFEIKMMGYLMNKNDMKVIPTVNRLVTFIELEEVVEYKNIIFEPTCGLDNSSFTYSFIFQPKSESTFSFNSQYNLTINQLIDIQNISRITIFINGTVIFDGTILSTPITTSINDQIKITVYKTGTTNSFKLLGYTS